jgi:hypothetical protein
MKKNDKTTQEKVNAYETTSPLLDSLYKEVQVLSKKKPEATLNKNKVTLINRLLSDIKDLLCDESDCKYLDLLDDEELPQYSDVVLILSQFSAAMERFHSNYYGWDEIEGGFLIFSKLFPHQSGVPLCSTLTD